tara:strand:+ start:1961 stop:3172 length:1212 start_codon:yes stop_codon:yes gene_type:complete
MANIVKLKHLEHLEDEMLNYGTDGCQAAVRFMNELVKMLGKKGSSAFMQTKWDGAPSVVCGTDPASGMFFVGNKSVFNTTNAKMCFTQEDIDFYYPDKGGLNQKLSMALEYFSQLNIKGVVQGDLMFTEEDKKNETINGENLITFRANTITYGIPVNHPIGKEVSDAKIGVVFHTHYKGSDLSTATAQAGAPIEQFSKIKECAVIQNDTPMNDIAIDESTLTKFKANVSDIEKLCSESGQFLDTLVSNMGTTGDKKFHVASYLKQFFNAEIKASRRIDDPIKALKNIGEFYREKMNKEINKMKSAPKITERRKQMYDGIQYLEDHSKEFTSMLRLYRLIQTSKQMVIDALDNLEKFRTYALTPNGYKATTPEGYVMHHDGDMIKLVNRIEFAYLNFTLDKSWK